MRKLALVLALCGAAAAAPANAEEPFKFSAGAPGGVALPAGDWPAFRFKSGGFGLDVAPEASVRQDFGARAASLGAVVRVGPAGREERVREGLDKLGLQARDGSSFRGQGRFYLFAAASGTSVGMNLTRGEDGDWRQSGLSTDAAPSLVMSAQAGVGWRKGDVQASAGYIRRKFKITDPRQQAFPDLYDSHDDAVALSLSFKPKR
jgi:hypothetical protein